MCPANGDCGLHSADIHRICMRYQLFNVHDYSDWHTIKGYFEKSILWDKINVAFKCNNSGHGGRERTIINTPVLLLLAEMLT